MVDLLTEQEIDELLSTTPTSENNSVIPQAIDPGIVWLNLRIALQFLKKHAPPYNSLVADSLLALTGLDQPGEWQSDLETKLAPLADKIAEERYSYIFKLPLDTHSISMMFGERHPQILEIVLHWMEASIKGRMSALCPSGEFPKSKFLERIGILAETFKLSSVENEILTVCLLDRISNRFREFINQVNNVTYFYGDNGLENWQRINQLSIFTSCAIEDLPSFFSENSNFRRLNFFSKILLLADELYEFIFSLREEPISDYYFRIWNGETLPLDRLMIKSSDLAAIKTILKNRRPGQGVNVLLAGPTGVGKTETVRSLSKELGLRLYEIRTLSSNETNDKEAFRLRALRAAQNLIQKNDESAILIDEADNLINDNGSYSFFGTSSQKNKALLNEALDRNQTVQFWIANDIDDIHPSTRRRFDFAIKYDRATFKDRLSIWMTAVERYDLGKIFDGNEQKRLAGTYVIDAGGIDSVLRNSANLPEQGLSKELIISYVENLLQAQSRFSPEADYSKPKKNRNRSIVAPEFLTVAPKEELESFLEIIEVNASQKENPLAFSVLLCGAPGTGKTEFAKYVADKLNKPLHQKTAASILSKWIGETEKNIRQAFAEAEREGAVLFFDEIDSLLHSRDKAERIWEVSQINEVLSALEDYEGVFIAATNNDHLLDKASLRRFHFQLSFDSLTPEGALRFYQTLLQPFSECELEENEQKKLMETEGLVPSDFATVRHRIALQPNKRWSFVSFFKMLQERRDARIGKQKASIIRFRKEISR